MKVYRSKRLVTGYEIGMENPDFYIPLPSTLWEDDEMLATFGNDKPRIFDRTEIVHTEKGFPNKRKRKITDPDKYDLHYCFYKRKESK